MPNGIEHDNQGAEHSDQSNAPVGGGEASFIEQVFHQFSGLLQGRQTPEISYAAAKKHGAFEFSTVRDSLDAHRCEIA